MSDLSHSVMLFVYRRPQGVPEYLILRHEPEHEGFWCPLKTPVAPGETVELAAIREASNTVLPAPRDTLIDLHHSERISFGDFDCVEWAVALDTKVPDPTVRLPDEYREYLWAPIEKAFPMVEEEATRRAIMKLHFHLAAAG